MSEKMSGATDQTVDNQGTQVAPAVQVTADPKLQAAISAAGPELSPLELETITRGWTAADHLEQRQRFDEAVPLGKDAVLAAARHLSETFDALLPLEGLVRRFEDEVPSDGQDYDCENCDEHDDEDCATCPNSDWNRCRATDALAARLLNAFMFAVLSRRGRNMLSLPGHDTAPPAADGASFVAAAKWLLQERPKWDAILRDETLRTIGIEGWKALYFTIDAVWETLDEIEFILDATTAGPAAAAMCALVAFLRSMCAQREECCSTCLWRLTANLVAAFKITDSASREGAISDVAAALRLAAALHDAAWDDGCRARYGSAVAALELLSPCHRLVIDGRSLDGADGAQVVEGQAAAAGADAPAQEGQRRPEVSPLPSVRMPKPCGWDAPPRVGDGQWRDLFQRHDPLTGEDILGLRIDDGAKWCLILRRPFLDGGAMRLLAADVAERALPIYERDYPGDDRPRYAIQAVRAQGGAVSDATVAGSAWQGARAAADEAAGNAKLAAEAAAAAAATSAGGGSNGALAARRALMYSVKAICGDVAGRSSFGECDSWFEEMTTQASELRWALDRARLYLRGEL